MTQTLCQGSVAASVPTASPGLEIATRTPWMGQVKAAALPPVSAAGSHGGQLSIVGSYDLKSRDFDHGRFAVRVGDPMNRHRHRHVGGRGSSRQEKKSVSDARHTSLVALPRSHYLLDCRERGTDRHRHAHHARRSSHQYTL
eukprot:TRINITY_DN3838_c0_g1_i2.p3 TRINITY_DN3838_c0_g1~~TRINITY_DN3838_c0_g1_i2.p3  ORF type:complete len:142 (+),score=7.08 TRINITY_DN3838_c0_g1_i2:84-509(+)